MNHILPPELRTVAERVVVALQHEAGRFSAAGATPQIELGAVQFTRVIDPASRQAGYEGIWRNTRNERCGTLNFNSDGSFYAEYDLFCQHPRDARWFVEMVAAWGRGDDVRSEARLMPAL